MSSRIEPEGSSGAAWKLPEELRVLAEMGDADVVREVIGVFQTDTEARIRRIADGLAEVNAARVRGEAHAIKGSAGQVGAMLISNLARDMEAAASRQDLAEASRLLPALEAAFAKVRLAMSSTEIP